MIGNILRFRKAMAAVNEGAYERKGARVALSHAVDELALSRYWPEQAVLAQGESSEVVGRYEGCAVQVSNEDTLACAERVVSQSPVGKHALPPLVLSFANPRAPGGGVKLGASAQEGELCRRSTLYASLASDEAAEFYRDNKAADGRLATHGVLISPCVEVFADAKGRPLADTFTVAVMTVPAPRTRGRGEDGGAARGIVDTRIRGMLGVAARCGYTRLILGAWGCGTFGNDPEQMAEAFVGALGSFGVRLSQRGESSPTPFGLVCFAVLDRSANRKAYRAFASRMAGW